MTVGQLAARHRVVVATRHPADDGVVGLGGLDDDHALALAATGTASHLRHKLKSALRGAKIGRVQQIIGIQNTYNADATKVETLGYHLRADKDIGLTTLESPDYAVISTLRGGGIAVEACHTSRREECGDSLLDLLRTEAHRLDIHRITLRTGTRNGGCITAVVTLHTVGRAVHRERHVTMRTAQSPTTRTTLHKGRKTSTILEQHSLLATLQSLANGV